MKKTIPTFLILLISINVFSQQVIPRGDITRIFFNSTDADMSIPDGSGSSIPGPAATITIQVPNEFNTSITDLHVHLTMKKIKRAY